MSEMEIKHTKINGQDMVCFPKAIEGNIKIMARGLLGRVLMWSIGIVLISIAIFIGVNAIWGFAAYGDLEASAIFVGAMVFLWVPWFAIHCLPGIGIVAAIWPPFRERLFEWFLEITQIEPSAMLSFNYTVALVLAAIMSVLSLFALIIAVVKMRRKKKGKDKSMSAMRM